MMFADNGEMLLEYVDPLLLRQVRQLISHSGNFADELGEDFLGLRNLGVAQEHGMQSLTIPSSVFYGRRKRQHDLAAAGYVLAILSSNLTPVTITDSRDDIGKKRKDPSTRPHRHLSHSSIRPIKPSSPRYSTRSLLPASKAVWDSRTTDLMRRIRRLGPWARLSSRTPQPRKRSPRS